MKNLKRNGIEANKKEFGWIRKEKKRKERNRGRRGREREKGKKGFLLLSKTYGDQTDGFRRSKRQSSSTRREIHVGTKIWEFCQTPRGRGFSYFGYF